MEVTSAGPLGPAWHPDDGPLLAAPLSSAAVAPLRNAWAKVVVRIAGSQVATVGMPMHGWLVRGTG